MAKNSFVVDVTFKGCHLSKIGKSDLVLGKNNLIVVIYGLNFSFKIQILRVFRRKKQRFFHAGQDLFIVF